jgi:hypothetical protein
MSRKEARMSYPDPRYLGDEGEISATFRPVDQGPELEIGAGRRDSFIGSLGELPR